MYDFLHGLLADRKDGEIFTCFGIWHALYILIVFFAIAAVYFAVRKKSAERKKKAARAFLYTAVGLYIADFFLMPFAYGQIDIEKLPFHVCTAMCVMCFVSDRAGFLQKYRVHFALLGFLSNLVYLLYPAGVMWHGVHPLCYRVWQTLLFHGAMTGYGVLTLLFEKGSLSFRTWYRDLVVLCGMTLWALWGNTLYDGVENGRFYNWFFVKQDPFGALPATIAPIVMPFLNVAVFFAVEMLLCLSARLLRGAGRREREGTE